MGFQRLVASLSRKDLKVPPTSVGGIQTFEARPHTYLRATDFKYHTRRVLLAHRHSTNTFALYTFLVAPVAWLRGAAGVVVVNSSGITGPVSQKTQNAT